MAIASPAWLDSSYMQKVLQNAEKDDSIEVSGINVRAATAKGDNYGSDMHRVTVEFSRSQDGHLTHAQKSVIVKIAPEGGIREELVSMPSKCQTTQSFTVLNLAEQLQATGIFVTELSMMAITLPGMDEILQKFGTTSLGARSLYVQYEKPIHLVIEDLAPRGFRMVDRQAGLDLDHSLLAVRNLGRFHAASVALKEKDPKSFTNYKMRIFHKDQSTIIRECISGMAVSFARETTKWSELDPRIPEKLLKLSEILYDKGIETAAYRDDDFNVLNHGDCWINNMLFRYDEQQKPVDHIFVDFQLCNYGSPALDLCNFFGTSPTDEVRLHHRELLLREYHTSLSSTMVKLKCATEVPSFDKLQEILKERNFYEVIYTIMGLPGVLLEKGAELDFNEILAKENASCSGKQYRKVMNRLLPLYDSAGLLDA